MKPFTSNRWFFNEGSCFENTEGKPPKDNGDSGGVAATDSAFALRKSHTEGPMQRVLDCLPEHDLWCDPLPRAPPLVMVVFNSSLEF